MKRKGEALTIALVIVFVVGVVSLANQVKQKKEVEKRIEVLEQQVEDENSGVGTY